MLKQRENSKYQYEKRLRSFFEYIQVVPELTNLPDMEAAFEKAILLDKEN
jgi:hypothetical protein